MNALPIYDYCDNGKILSIASSYPQQPIEILKP